ncbi:type II toxin-antitoxin system Phd/YefM family antitoxin [Enterococcus sp. AZ109]|uniref:type II toxin-antitoxin system Phd/YefM family antitoxin n=1 Tax=Enterococcus sp. AZ109 TaxID=2774634 RepID=UPI003F28A353
MLDAIKNELVSISDLKKSPMASIEKAQKTHNGVYVLNNNKAVAVILDTENYNQLIENYQKISIENDQLLDRIVELETLRRIAMKVDYLPDAEVRGEESLVAELLDIEDEWE